MPSREIKSTEKKFFTILGNRRVIQIEATSSQKVCATSVSTGDQGGEPTFAQWPQCYRVWNEIEIFQISDKNHYYALNHGCNRL